MSQATKQKKERRKKTKTKTKKMKEPSSGRTRRKSVTSKALAQQQKKQTAPRSIPNEKQETQRASKQAQGKIKKRPHGQLDHQRKARTPKSPKQVHVSAWQKSKKVKKSQKKKKKDRTEKKKKKKTGPYVNHHSHPPWPCRGHRAGGRKYRLKI